MKRSVKGILIASGIFLAAGLSLVFAGILMGATWSQLGDTIISGKYSIGGNIISFGDYDGDKLSGMNLIDAEEYDAAEIKNIIVDVGAGELKVNNNDSEKITLENDSNRGKLGVSITDDTMYIVLQGKTWSSGGKAEISIPKDIKFQNVQMDISAGDVKVDSLKTEQFDVSVGAGKLTCTGKIETEISSWDVDAGSISADWVKSSQTDLDCDAGKIEITLEGAQDDFGFDGSCSAGKIEFGADKYHSDAEVYRHDGHAEQFVTASCDAGKIVINFTK